MRERGYRFVLAAFVVAIGVVVVVAFVPLGTSVEEVVAETQADATAHGETTIHVERSQWVERHTIAESDGWGVVLGITLPLLAISGFPLFATGRRRAIAARGASTALLVVGILLAMSLSIFIAPIALLMLIATILAVADRRTTPIRAG